MKKERSLRHLCMRARRTLKSARLLYQEEYYEESVSRSYYAVYYAAAAALLIRNVTSKSHEGLQQMFGKHLVNQGEIEKEWARILGLEFRYRIGADYLDSDDITSDIAKEMLDDAERFVHRIEEYLRANGVELSE